MSGSYPQFYILVGRQPFAVDAETWAKSFDQKNRTVAYTQIDESHYVSTVFLGLNHSFSERGDPILFESMIFGGPLDQTMCRYRTYAEAEKGHKVMVEVAIKANTQVDSILQEALKHD